MPQADNTAATRGTITRRRSSWRAMSVACSPAAPPKANNAKRRGSTPRRTETRRTPSAIVVLTRRWMPRAAAMRSTPSAAAMRSTARSAAARSRLRRPPRKRAGAVRPDMEDAAAIDPRDRAATGADADDVEAAEGQALAGDLAPLGEGGLARDDQRNVGAGPAHVERDQIGFAEKARGMEGTGDAARRARQHRAGGKPPRRGDRHDPAMRLDDQGRAAIAGLFETAFEAVEIARQRRPDIGVDDRR